MIISRAKILSKCWIIQKSPRQRLLIFWCKAFQYRATIILCSKRHLTKTLHHSELNLKWCSSMSAQQSFLFRLPRIVWRMKASNGSFQYDQGVFDLQEVNDAMLTILMGSLTQGSTQVLDLIERCEVAYPRRWIRVSGNHLYNACLCKRAWIDTNVYRQISSFVSYPWDHVQDLGHFGVSDFRPHFCSSFTSGIIYRMDTQRRSFD